MARQDVFAIRGDRHRHAFPPHHLAELNIAVRVQHPGRLALVEHEDRTVRQRPVARRDQAAEGTVALLAKDLHLDPAVVRRHEDATTGDRRH